MLAGSTVIVVLTSVALGFAWAKPQIFGSNGPRILVLWGGLILPSVILATLVISAFVLGERLILQSGSAPPLRIEAEGRQWSWEFRYPDAGAVTHDVLHIPAGREVEFIVTSTDVIHSFWVPRLGGKIDAVPGHQNKILLSADRPGRYGGICAEYCGDGHDVMRFMVEAHPAETYDAMLAQIAAGGTP